MMEAPSSATFRSARVKRPPRSSPERARSRRPSLVPKQPVAPSPPEDDLPFADPTDVEALAEQLFTEDEISDWASSAAESDRVPSARSVPQDAHEAKTEARPEPKAEPKQIQEVTPPRPRRRLRTQLARPFAYEGVAVAPAARSARRFTERSAIDDVEGWTSERWPTVAAIVVGLMIAVWVLLSW